jgi:Retrotransposon gag protein/Zinc knuckle
MTDYDAFCEELKTNFGPSDPVGDAESKLRTLTMKSDQRIAKYVVNFNRLATQVLWGENALRYQFYTGLPDRIKDQIANVGKPATLADLRNLAQNIDHRYWERKSEVSREAKPATSNPHNKPSSSSSSSSWRSNTKSGSSSASTPKASSSSSKKPDISHLLSEGKLTDSERQRRIKENLCMYCGASGHMAKDCRKRNAAAAPKARAADVTPVDPKPEK